MRDMSSSRIMPRTTLDLDPTVLEELRRRRIKEKKTMGQVASELLARALKANPTVTAAPELQWTSRDLGVPKVDLEDKEALRRALDAPP
jgi:hypothetical protein